MEQVGDINKVVVDLSGKVEGVDVNAGPLLDTPEHEVVVPLDKIKLSDETVSSVGTYETYVDIR
jgi:hypothetical protein